MTSSPRRPAASPERCCAVPAWPWWATHSPRLLTLGFYIVLARLATPEEFGQFAAASIVVNVGLLFTESGMLAALIHRRDRIEAAASTAVVSTALGGLTLQPAGARPLAADR